MWKSAQHSTQERGPTSRVAVNKSTVRGPRQFPLWCSMSAIFPAAVSSVQVAVRVRPFNARELSMNAQCVVEMPDATTVLLRMPPKPKTVQSAGDEAAFDESLERKFTFSHAYWSHDGYDVSLDGTIEPASKMPPGSGGSFYASQEHIFDEIGKPILESCLSGYAGTVLSYGQTGSGKSYSIFGHQNNPGIIPLACKVRDPSRDACLTLLGSLTAPAPAPAPLLVLSGRSCSGCAH